jgi:hypothetical protein
LDEILARYIGSMANYVREIMMHKNYRDMEKINTLLSQTQPSVC